MRRPLVLVLVTLLSASAWGRSKGLTHAIGLYESGQLGQARDRLERLVKQPHVSEPDRIQAQLYLAATELTLQEPERAREELTALLRRHPKVRLDPAVFSPELVVLTEQIRQELEAQRPKAKPSRQQLEAQRQAEQQKQLEAQQEAERQKQLEAQRAAEQQKQLEAQRAAEQQKQLEVQQRQAERLAALTPAVAPEAPLAAQSTTVAEDHGARRTWGYVALGVAGAATAVGILFASGAKSSARDAAGATELTAYDKAKSDANGKAKVASVGFIAAGIAAAGGGILIGTSF